MPSPPQLRGQQGFPDSVEEAGALLGASITLCGKETRTVLAPPAGMHSSFATIKPVPSTELLTRLHDLRALLRSHTSKEKPLSAAASLLAVLMKILGVSTTMAAAQSVAGGSGDTSRSQRLGSGEAPPMLSTPFRKLWVDCVVLCHRLGDGLSGTAKIRTTDFMRSMLALAGTNPRSAKAAGGVRIAALDVIAGLYRDDKLSAQLSNWTLEVLQVCLRALRSAGNGEPTYRVSAMRTACATAVSCRQSRLKTSPIPLEGKDLLVVQNAMEDKAIAEAVKLLHQAVTDKFPEVRSAAATYACLLAPLLLQSSSSTKQDGGPTLYLEDVMNLALKNIDDESPAVSEGWAEALARTMSTTIHYNEQVKANASEDRNADRDAENGDGLASSRSATNADSTSSVRLGARKNAGWLMACSSLKNAVSVMVDVFIKAGGELTASKAGGSFSSGGRAVRVGMSLVLTKLFRLQSELGSIGEGRSITMNESLLAILEMVGDNAAKQLKPPTSGSGGPTNPLFGATRIWSRADAVLVRLAANRVLRQGLAEVASEPVQLGLLQDLVDLIPSLPAQLQNNSNNTGATTKESSGGLNPHQLQVLLVELSHLLATLGEASASKLEDIIPKLSSCLSHSNQGVRHEAAIACSAIASVSPSDGLKLLRASVDEIQIEMASLTTSVAMEGGKTKSEVEDQTSGFAMFRRLNSKEKQSVDATLPHQFAIHGRVLMVSLLLRDLPRLPGGLPAELLAMVLSVAEILVSYQFNEVVNKKNPGAACACVRAGFVIISGALATGPAGIARHIPVIFETWKKCSSSAKKGREQFAARYDLYCLDALLSSVVVFLKYCSELLLEIPEALCQITMLLEEILPLFLPQGRIGGIPLTASVAARIECAEASLLEAFAWLPSGSFPMAADMVFDFAAQRIQQGIETDVTCSLLHAIVNKEDSILDSKTISRVNGDGQTGGARDIEESIISMTAEVALHEEREAVLNLLCDEPSNNFEDGDTFRGSYILGLFARNQKTKNPPTPLHEVGAWRQPIHASRSSKVRLVDAAIQAFSATFGLKSGQEQQIAMNLLETLIPPLLAQLARTIGVNAARIEQDRKSKSKEDSAVANITAVILSCLQALPLHEATHNVPIGLGPPWMNKAKDLLLTLLPSQSNVVRRAAAEGLALLATLGVTEDAHFLQSTVLHSLDEVMRGNKPDGKPRPTIALEPVSAARAGSLLTLACIQRTTHNVAQRQLARARGRSVSNPNEESGKKTDDELPVLQMMTRLLPSIDCRGFRDYFVVRTYALHSFTVLLTYSGRLDQGSLSDQDKQLLRKGIELVESNFSSCWTAASTDIDRGQEAEKMASEASFLAVLLRLMTFLIPSLQQLRTETPECAYKFSFMATLVLENHGWHPVVFNEAMAFFEVLASHRQLLSPPLKCIDFTENAFFSSIPFVLECITPIRATCFAHLPWEEGPIMSPVSLRAAVYMIKILSLSQISVTEWIGMKLASHLVALFEAVCGARYYVGANLLRSIAAPWESEVVFAESAALEEEIFNTIPVLLFFECSFHKNEKERLVRWILFTRSLLSNTGVIPAADPHDTTDFTPASVSQAAIMQSFLDTSLVYETANPVRWQVKCLAAQLSTVALAEMARNTSVPNSEDPHLSLTAANTQCRKLCREAEEAGRGLPSSRLVFHLEDILAAACMSVTATQDQAELRTLQESSMHFLTKLISSFGRIRDPEQPESSILDQYSTQIFSAVKHALGAPLESDSDAALGLFVAGCEALQTVIETELSKDTVVLKRLIRPVVPADSDIPFFTYTNGYPASVQTVDAKEIHSNRRAALLLKIGKVWTSGKLGLTSGGVGRPEYMHVVAQALVTNDVAMAVNSAAIAIDGIRLLLGSGLSLAGKSLPEDDARKTIECESGIFYGNLTDINDTVKALLAKTWSSCASNALRPLLATVELTDCDQERRDACAEWIKTLIPILFAGVRDAHGANMKSNGQEIVSWARGVDPTTVVVDCLSGIVLLVNDTTGVIFDPQWSAELNNLVYQLGALVLVPALTTASDVSSLTKSSTEEPKIVPNPVVVLEACKLIEGLASAFGSGAELEHESALLVAILAPLDMLESGALKFGEGVVETIIATCLSSVASLITQGFSRDTLTKTTLQLVLKTVLAEGNRDKCPTKVKEAGNKLLHACLNHNSVSPRQQSNIAVDLAAAGNWETWAVVFSMNDGKAASKSLDIVVQVLCDPSQARSQVAVLTAIHSIVQNPSVSSSLIGLLLHRIGSEVLGVFFNFGTAQINREVYEYRKTACAHSMKVMLLGYQQLCSAEDSDEEVTSFILVLFETLLAVLRFNGLPNHPSPSIDGCAALGRMVAQAILHIARTSPVPFKTAVASLGQTDRTLLEFAVRAEMSGYAVATQNAPVKKKLDLKSFKK